jgi:heme/copper-type cytochrome/quinol oxidase subunit 2
MTEKTASLKTQIWSLVLIIIILVMGIEIIFLVKENRKLKAAITAT